MDLNRGGKDKSFYPKVDIPKVGKPKTNRYHKKILREMKKGLPRLG